MLPASGRVRIFSTQALRYACSLADTVDATITLPNGRSLELPDSDVSFYMPPEWAPHQCTWMAWPKRYDVWRNAAKPAKEAYCNVIKALARFEPVTVLAHRDQVCRAAMACTVELHGAVLFIQSRIPGNNPFWQ